jgi:Phospholipase_D-nuclease N-terminal
MDIWSWFAVFFWMYLVFACIWLFITVLIDVFRDDSLGGGAKALWVILVLILPLIGSLIYLIARGKHMAERRYRESGIVPEPTDYTPHYGV